MHRLQANTSECGTIQKGQGGIMEQGLKTENRFREQYIYTSAMVVEELTMALHSVDVEALERLKGDILSANRVFFTGVGRVMLSLEAMAKRFSHLGIRCSCVGEITEPAIQPGDILIVGSGSGASIVPLAIAKKAKELGIKVIHIGSNSESEMKYLADYIVRVPVRTRLYLPDEIESKQIMTSLFEQSLLLLGDILASMIVEERNIDLRELWEYHANLE